MKTLTKQNEQHVPSRHFERHPEFAIGPEQHTVSAWHTAVTLAVSALEPRPVDEFDCPLYRFADEGDGRLKLIIERRVTKPRTLVSGWKARQIGNGTAPADETLLDDAFDLEGKGFQLPEPTLRAMLEAFANSNRRKLDGYQLLQLARAFSTLIAARHGVALGVNDL
jgi:hypothetical protein